VPVRHQGAGLGGRRQAAAQGKTINDSKFEAGDAHLTIGPAAS
jgi:hypothetical protein